MYFSLLISVLCIFCIAQFYFCLCFSHYFMFSPILPVLLFVLLYYCVVNKVVGVFCFVLFNKKTLSGSLLAVTAQCVLGFCTDMKLPLITACWTENRLVWMMNRQQNNKRYASNYKRGRMITITALSH